MEIMDTPGMQSLRASIKSNMSSILSRKEGDDIGTPMHIHPNDMVAFKEHSFQIRDDADMAELTQSIEKAGKIREPILAFWNEENNIEIIAGHRRRYVAQKLGFETVPVLVMKISREDATFLMCESNMKKRTVLLPSERAYSYKVMIEAMGRRQGQRTDKNDDNKGKTVELLSEKIGVPSATIERYMRLNYLIPEILKLVDQGAIKKNTGMAKQPAIEISYLPENYQQVILDIYKQEEKTPSHSQARKFKRLFEAKQLDEKKIIEIMNEPKPNQKRSSGMVITNENLLMFKKSSGLADEAFQQMLVKALDFYQRHGHQGQASGSASSSNKAHL